MEVYLSNYHITIGDKVSHLELMTTGGDFKIRIHTNGLEFLADDIIRHLRRAENERNNKNVQLSLFDRG